MTFVLGDAFDLFTVYQAVQSYQATLPPSIQDMSEANHDLKQGMITVTIKLIILGCIIVALTTASLALWVWHGEKVAKRLRRTVYLGVVRKPMAWFDLGMGKRIGDSAGQDNNAVEENESSGGLMGRFTT